MSEKKWYYRPSEMGWTLFKPDGFGVAKFYDYQELNQVTDTMNAAKMVVSEVSANDQIGDIESNAIRALEKAVGDN